MNNLLLVIDLQNGWRHSATEKAMLNTVKLCRKFKGDVIHCCFRNDPKSLFHKQLGWRRFVKPADTDQIPEIAALSLKQCWRTTYSCLNEQTRQLIRRYDRVYLAGVFTDISIYVTALAIFDENISVSVVTDCVATLHGQQAHNSALKSLGFAIGDRNLIDSNKL